MADALTLRRRRRPIHWSDPVVYAIALSVAGVAVAPVVYVVLGGFRSNGQLAAHPAGWPAPWIFRNYRSVLTSGAFWHQVMASTFTALGTTIGVVALGAMATFVLARFQFRGREALYTFFTLGLL